MEYDNQYKYYEKRNPLINLLLWLLFLPFFILSSLLFSITIYISVVSDWDVSNYYSESSFQFFVSIFPYFSFILFLIFLLISLAIFFISRLKEDLSTYKSVIIIVFVCMLCGISFYYFGLNHKIDSAFSNYSFYYYLTGDRNKVWQAPESGLLSGEIGIINDLNDFLLVDFSGQTWSIKSYDPEIKDNSIIRTGNKIKLIGRKNQNFVFDALEIRPY